MSNEWIKDVTLPFRLLWWYYFKSESPKTKTMKIKRAFLGQEVIGPSLDGVGVIDDFYLSDLGSFWVKIKMKEDGFMIHKPLGRVCPYNQKQEEDE